MGREEQSVLQIKREGRQVQPELFEESASVDANFFATSGVNENHVDTLLQTCPNRVELPQTVFQNGTSVNTDAIHRAAFALVDLLVRLDKSLEQFNAVGKWYQIGHGLDQLVCSRCVEQNLLNQLVTIELSNNPATHDIDQR